MCLNKICGSFVSYHLQCKLHKRGFDMPPSVFTTCVMCVCVTCVTEKLKFTPTPQPAQCLELDNQIIIQCSAKGRESPTIRWTKAGVHTTGLTFRHNSLNQMRNDCLTLKEIRHPKCSRTLHSFYTNDGKCGFNKNM